MQPFNYHYQSERLVLRVLKSEHWDPEHFLLLTKRWTITKCEQIQNVNNHLQNVSKIPKTLERESHVCEKNWFEQMMKTVAS